MTIPQKLHGVPCVPWMSTLSYVPPGTPTIQSMSVWVLPPGPVLSPNPDGWDRHVQACPACRQDYEGLVEAVRLYGE